MSSLSITEPKIPLDELVLTRCISRIALVERIRLELVNGRLASLFTVANSLEKISLKIKRIIDGECDNPECLEEPPDDAEMHTHLIISTRGRTYEVKLNTDDLLKCCFIRFKRFRSLEYLDHKSDPFYFALSDLFNNDRLRPVEVIRLKFTGSLKQKDWPVIERLSVSLRELHLNCIMPLDRIVCLRLWHLVSTCTNLQKLTFRPWNGLTRFARIQKDRHSNRFLRETLQQLNISHFEGFLDESYDEVWLNDCFKNNANLQYLSFYGENKHDLPRLFSMLATPKALEIIHKLSTFQTSTGSSNKLNILGSNILRILSALPRSACLKTVTKIEHHAVPFGHDPTSAVVQAVVDCLIFWLKKSDDTGRMVKLCVAFKNGPDNESMDAAIEKIMSMEGYDSLIVEKTNIRTILRHKNAKIVLSLSDFSTNNQINVW